MVPSATGSSSRAAALWRGALLALCVISAVLTVVSLESGSIVASEILRANMIAAQVPGVYVARGVTSSRSGPEGLRDGDLIDARIQPFAVRYRLYSGVAPHQHLRLLVQRGGAQQYADYVADGGPPWRWDLGLLYLGAFWLLCFSAALAWHRSGQPQARIAALCLLTTATPIFIIAGNWVSSSATLDASLNVLGNTVLVGTPALLTGYAAASVTRMSRLQRSLVNLAYSVTAIAASYCMTLLAFQTFVSGSPLAPTQLVGFEWTRFAAALASLVAFVVILREARGVERQRLLWSSVIALPAVIIVVSGISGWFLPPSWTEYSGFSLWLVVDDAVLFLMPLVLTYVLLNRRLVDFAFVLNRAAVFSAVSLQIVSIFVLVEWALADWLNATSHAANVGVTAALVLALGMSIRFLHSRIDNFIDRVFFHKRHENEAAVYAFAEDAPYIIDRATLLRRAVETLERHTDAASVDLLLFDGDGTSGKVDQDDPALVRLRSTHRIVELHGLDSVIDGDMALPLMCRTDLLGAIVLGERRSGERYAPDEKAAFQRLAYAVGIALDAFRGRRSEETAVILEAIERLGLRLDALDSGAGLNTSSLDVVLETIK